MSTTYAAAAKALANDPELLAKVTKAGSAEERAAHLSAAGVAVPTHADVNAHLANMAGVAGGSDTGTYAGVAAVAGVAAASSAAAA
jgi:hypothetical protein